MKKKMLALLFVTLLSVSIVACGSKNSSDEKITETAEKTSDQKETNENSHIDTELETLGEVEVEKELFDVILTIPAEYIGETTQEELDAAGAEAGYTVVLNEDGSATYTMTKSQHKELLAGISESINKSLEEMIGSEDYPSFTDIAANEDYTTFTITTTSTELDMNESFSVMLFYTYGGMYNIFTGNTVDNIHVDFVNADSGEIISSADSSDM